MITYLLNKVQVVQVHMLSRYPSTFMYQDDHGQVTPELILLWDFYVLLVTEVAVLFQHNSLASKKDSEQHLSFSAPRSSPDFNPILR